MSVYRDYEKKDESRRYTYTDYLIIEELLKSDRITDEEKKAIDHLKFSYDYATD